MEDKKVLRKRILQSRNNISKAEIGQLSQQIAEQFLSLQELKNATNIMLYYSYRNEVDTIPLMNKLLEQGKEIFLPYTIVETRELRITLIKDVVKDLKSGNYGIMEPIVRQNFNPEKLDLVVVPALAYDRQGHRLGYGGGYYDRFLRKLKKDTITIGLTYSSFLLKELPQEGHDLPVDIILTELEVLHIGGDNNESF